MLLKTFKQVIPKGNFKVSLRCKEIDTGLVFFLKEKKKTVRKMERDVMLSNKDF